MNESRDWQNLGGTRKAAIVLLSLGKEAATQVVKNLKDSDVEKIAAEMASLGRIPADVQENVLREFTGAMGSAGAQGLGGIGRAAAFLEATLGRQKASEIVTRMKRLNATGALRKLEQMEPGMAAELLADEHPQAIALIMAQVEPDFAAGTLSAFPPELRADVAMRVARLEGISVDTTKEIEGILATQLQGMAGRDVATADGVKILADILNSTERETEKEVLEAIESKDDSVAAEVRKLMFVFDDILLLEDRSVQRVLREVDTKDLAVALKAADEEVKAKIFKNISERAAAMIQEEIDYMGPKRLSEVEAAQMAVIEVIRNLEESGEIIVPGLDGGSWETGESAEDEQGGAGGETHIKQAYKAGYDAGQAACREAFAGETEACVGRFRSMLEDLASQRRRLIKESEAAVLRVACDIARRIVGKSAEIRDDVILEVVRSALGHMNENHSMTIRVNPRDLEVLARCESEWLESARAGGMKITEDARIKPGGCLIEGETGSVEAQIDRQIDVIEKALMEACK